MKTIVYRLRPISRRRGLFSFCPVSVGIIDPFVWIMSGIVIGFVFSSITSLTSSLRVFSGDPCMIASALYSLRNYFSSSIDVEVIDISVSIKCLN